MTNKEIQEYVYEERGKLDEGNVFKTFSKIAEELSEITGRPFSRQNVHGIYKKILKRKTTESGEFSNIITVLNIYSRTDNYSETIDISTKMGININNYKLRRYLEDYEENLYEIRDTLKEIVVDGIRTGDSIEELKERLKYLDIEIQQRSYEQYIKDASLDIIKGKIESVIMKAMYYSDSRAVGKQILDIYNTGESITVIYNKNRKDT